MVDTYLPLHHTALCCKPQLSLNGLERFIACTVAFVTFMPSVVSTVFIVAFILVLVIVVFITAVVVLTAASTFMITSVVVGPESYGERRVSVAIAWKRNMARRFRCLGQRARKSGSTKKCFGLRQNRHWRSAGSELPVHIHPAPPCFGPHDGERDSRTSARAVGRDTRTRVCPGRIKVRAGRGNHSDGDR